MIEERQTNHNFDTRGTDGRAQLNLHFTVHCIRKRMGIQNESQKGAGFVNGKF